MTNISMNAAPALASPVVKSKRKQSSVAHDRALTLLIFLPPALLLFTLFVILPMGEAAWYSLYRWNGYGTPSEFIGLKNFQVLFGNAAFSQALINNALIIVISICIQIPLAIWLATMLAHAFQVLWRFVSSSSCPMFWQMSQPVLSGALSMTATTVSLPPFRTSSGSPIPMCWRIRMLRSMPCLPSSSGSISAST